MSKVVFLHILTMEVMFMYEVYTVKSGDTLSSISSYYGMNENELRRINGFSPIDEVVASSLIVVPVRGKRNYQYYTVKKGDSIYEIAKNKGIDYHLLLQLNGLEKDDYIYPNQSLMLPADDVSLYLVKENETLNDILKKFNVSIEELMKGNEKIYLREGQLLGFSKK